ncbi:hypothetical protein ACJ73_10235, partial [Blastomyces percursus]
LILTIPSRCLMRTAAGDFGQLLAVTVREMHAHSALITPEAHRWLRKPRAG